MGKTKDTQGASDTGAEAMTAAMRALNPAASGAWMDVMTESARFVSDRLQQDLETQKALLACKSPADLLKVQTEFYQTAMEQYAAEATKLFQMMSSATQECVDTTKSTKARKYNDVPL